jgi:hypothetical protein
MIGSLHLIELCRQLHEGWRGVETLCRYTGMSSLNVFNRYIDWCHGNYISLITWINHVVCNLFHLWSWMKFQRWDNVVRLINEWDCTSTRRSPICSNPLKCEAQLNNVTIFVFWDVTPFSFAGGRSIWRNQLPVMKMVAVAPSKILAHQFALSFYLSMCTCFALPVFLFVFSYVVFLPCIPTSDV